MCTSLCSIWKKCQKRPKNGLFSKDWRLTHCWISTFKIYDREVSNTYYAHHEGCIVTAYVSWIMISIFTPTRMWYLSGQLSKKPLGPQLLSHPTLPLGISIILCKQLFELVVIAAASHIHDNYSKGLWSIWAPLLCKYSINRMSSWAQTPGTWILLN